MTQQTPSSDVEPRAPNMQDASASSTRADPSQPGRPDPEKTAFDAGRTASSHRWLLMAVAIVSILSGLVAIAMPFIASLTAAFITGAALLATGIVGLITAFKRKEGWHVAAAFALALLSCVAGVLMFAQPFAGIFALTTLIIAWLGASGIARLYYGARLFGQGGGWMVATGVLSVVVAVMMLMGLPMTAVWAPGVLLGVDLILWGAVLLALGLRAGRGDISFSDAARA